jgi:hypothetical protein
VKTVSLIINDTNGCTDTFISSVTVKDNPVAKIGVNTAVQCFQNNSFDFNSTGSLTGFGSTVSTYNWIFDNNSWKNHASPATGSISNVVGVNYDTLGGFKIKLTVTNTSGCTDTAMFAVRVKENPKAKWSVGNFVQ